MNSISPIPCPRKGSFSKAENRDEYGYYRERLDFTWDNLERTAGKLVSIKEMIKQLSVIDSAGKGECQEAQVLIQGMKKIFRERMGDDLDVKGACDGIGEKLSGLMSLKNRGAFGGGDAEYLRKTWGKIDEVLQVQKLEPSDRAK